MVHFGDADAGAAFEIAVRTSGLPDGSLVPRVERRVRTALRRYAAHIRAVRVRLRDVNGPRGGVDKECTIAVRLALPHRLLLIEDVDASAAVATDRAADRAARAVVRAVQSWHPRRGKARG